MHRFPELAWFIGDELMAVAEAMADGSYWKEEYNPRAPDYYDRIGENVGGGGGD